MRKKTTSARVSSKIQNVIRIAINHENKRRRRQQRRKASLKDGVKSSSSMLRPVVNFSTGNDDISKILGQVRTERAVAELGRKIDEIIKNPLLKSVAPTPSLTLGEVSRGLTRDKENPSNLITHTGGGEEAKDEGTPPQTPPPQKTTEPPAPKSEKRRPFFSLFPLSLSLSPLRTPTSPQGIVWGGRAEEEEETPATTTDRKVQELREYLIANRSLIPRKKDYTIEDINRLSNINHIRDLYNATKKVVRGKDGGGGASFV